MQGPFCYAEGFGVGEERDEEGWEGGGSGEVVDAVREDDVVERGPGVG